MAEEIQEAVQIIRVAYEGIEIAIRIGSGGLSAAQKVMESLIGMLEYEKTMGKTSMKKLLMKGGDLQAFQYKTKESGQVKKLLKKYGILYSELPDINQKDGMSELIFHAEAVPRMNMIATKLTHGRIGSFEEYIKDGDETELRKLLKFLKGQKLGNAHAHTEEAETVNEMVDDLIQKVGMFVTGKTQISVDEVRETFDIGQVTAEDVMKQLETLGVLDKQDTYGMYTVLVDQPSFEERLKGYGRLLERMKAVAQVQDGALMDITINQSLIAEENQNAVKTRVPGTYGDDIRYLWISKENLVEIHEGKTMLTFLDPQKEYKLYDKENRVAERKDGQNLYDHYDKVETAVRERYKQSQRQTNKRNGSRPKKSDKRRR